MPAELCARFEGLINRFIHEVDFHGADDLDVTEEMRVVIAAQACLLVVNKPNRWYDSLRTIIVYPGAFASRIRTGDGAVVHEHEVARSGESWGRGPVILSWEHARFGAERPDDGRNVVFHEFAHQLDDQTGVTDGAPLLDKTHDDRAWAVAFRSAYNRLQADIAAGRRPFLDPYGATKPAEFFAVATEYFFERATELKAEEPDIYAQMAAYYRLDPAAWD